MESSNFQVEDLLCNESFQRFCRGEDQTDIIFWKNWIETHPDQSHMINNAQRLFDALNLGQGNRMEQSTALRDAIARRKRFADTVINKPKVRRLNTKHLIGYAAGIVLLISAGTLAYIKYNANRYEYYTSKNIHKTVMLPDGSMVILNENSHLTLNKNFDAAHRDVTITGEAFFDIKQDALHPFEVHTSEYKIRVLGTSFNVRSYPQNKGTETALITGKVEIIPNTAGNAKERIVLQPNQKFILEQGTPAAAIPGLAAVPAKRSIAKVQIDPITNYIKETSWARRKIEITDQTFEQIAEQLESWYGINIIFTSETVKKYRYTASFNDETIFKVLQYLQQSYPFTYKIEQGSIVISRN